MSIPLLERRGREFLDELDRVVGHAYLFPSDKLPKLRSIMEAMCKDRLPKGVQASSLYERVSIFANQQRLPYPIRTGLHGLRLVANKVLHERYEATLDEYHAAVDALYKTLRLVYGVQVDEAKWQMTKQVSLQEVVLPAPIEAPIVANTEVAVAVVPFTQTALPDAELTQIEPLAEHEQNQLPDAAVLPQFAPDDLSTFRRQAELRALVINVNAETHTCEVLLEDDPTEQHYLVRYAVKGVTDVFQDADRYLRPSTAGKSVMVNLIDVVFLPDGSLMPRELVLAPDYLFDATAIAECFGEGGPVLESYLLNQIKPLVVHKSGPLFLGTIVNFMFDRMMNSHIKNADSFDFNNFITKELFQNFPFEFATYFLPPKDSENEAEQKGSSADPLADFIDKLRIHARTIAYTIQNGFTATYIADKKEELKLSLQHTFQEASFFSTRFGIQGRADLLHINPETNYLDIVELKSGSPPIRGVRPNNRVQGLLYNKMLQSVFGQEESLYRTRILYSKAEPKNAIRDLGDYREYHNDTLTNQQAMHLRNRLAAMEFYIGREEDELAIWRLICKQVQYLENSPLPFMAQDASWLHTSLRNLDELEQRFYATFVRFAIRERILTKIGTDADSSRGQVSLWQADKHDPDNYGVLTGLSLQTNGMAQQNDPYIVLKRPYGASNEVNFRRGDQVVVYAQVPQQEEVIPNAVNVELSYIRQSPRYNPLRTQVFRGSIDDIKLDAITIRFKTSQHITQYFENQGLWAIEQDVQDHLGKQFLQPLTEVMIGSKARRQLLMGRTKPAAPDNVPPLAHPEYLTALQAQQIANIYASPDYHIVIGPPGTGKTSIYLRSLVCEFMAREPAEHRLLLLAYTNRAVDEICEQLEHLQLDYIRIGSRQATPEAMQSRLLNALGAAVDNPETAPEALRRRIEALPAGLRKRQQLTALLEQNRIVVGTIASIGTRSDILSITPFHMAIVDEASQLVEPPLLRILMQVQRFILIGDDRQLPAVVLQVPEQTAVPADSPLREIGLTDLRNSYFERLLNRCREWKADHAVTELQHQGRMHAEVAAFPAKHFYGGRLQLSEHPERNSQQQAPFILPLQDTENAVNKLLSKHRLVWVKTLPNSLLERQLRLKNPRQENLNSKTNIAEAQQVVQVAQVWAAHYRSQGIDDESIAKKYIGIIAPFRNQISEIRHQLEATADPALALVVVDTVERYQGSQRLHIIASLCANSTRQLDEMMSMHADEQTDRKLNVLLTRAREQLVLVGAPTVLTQHPVYQALLEHITQHGAVYDATQNSPP